MDNIIRRATLKDSDRILEIFAIAKEFMRKSDNKKQWGDGYPNMDNIIEDIENDNLYVIESGDKVEAVFAMLKTPEPTYSEIEGEWISDNEYITLHRIASSGNIKDVFKMATDFALQHKNTVRVDTHKDNMPMQRVISKRGYKYCGIITLASGNTRLAYELIED